MLNISRAVMLSCHQLWLRRSIRSCEVVGIWSRCLNVVWMPEASSLTVCSWSSQTAASVSARNELHDCVLFSRQSPHHCNTSSSLILVCTHTYTIFITHSGTSSSISYSPIPSPITSSSSDLPLCTSITPSLFYSRLKTYLFHKSYPP